ncbi:methylated-DNA--[protein]-cysteine S-methyltransferase [Gordonia sp. DT30]|uniref:methylated-DNA--[protein]-cysteine S-methyltransferase n=1 Tax=Gordonia sp. DT30 TaxID=3416546 RepID=UPI003CFB2DCC
MPETITTDPADAQTAVPTSTSTGIGLWTTVSTPDGPFTVVADEDAVVLASGWTDAPEYLVALVNRGLRPVGLLSPAEFRRTATLVAVTDAVAAYYAGEFDAPAAITVRQRGGPFIERSWAALRNVPAGAPVTYSQLAERAGEPAAIRAAASSCARNAAALFVPCHRVQRRDGALGGFRYGLPIKRALIDREAPPADE